MTQKKAKRSRKAKSVAADYLAKQKDSMRRKHRQVIYLNDRELAAIDEYCRKFKITSRSAVFRAAAVEHVLTVLDENHPTLF